MKKRSLFWLVTLACTVTTVWPQIPDASSILQRMPDQRALQALLGRETGDAELARSIPMEGAIDANRYIVGPGDVVNLGLWGGPITNTFSLTVTPENSLIIPTVGEIKVDHMKLADVKKTASEFVRRKYPSSSVTLTLISLRSFIITVTGTVLNQGQYRATPVDRVEKVVVQASRVFLPAATVTVQAVPKKEEPEVREAFYNDPKMNQVAEIFTSISTRNILLIRRGGDTVRVDIPKFYATMNDRYNPSLLEGDIVFVPRKVLERDFIAVYGEVNAPGKYEYVEGDSLFDALLIAQGVTPQCDLSKVSVNRLNDRGETMEELSLDFLKDGPKANIRLRRGDRITVGAVSNQKFDYRVQIRGGVKSPGYYPISLRSTKLSKVVDLAGGFTREALLSGAVVLRKEEQLIRYTDPKLDAARNLRSFRPQMSDSAFYFLSAEIGRQPVVVDFVRLFENGDSTQDIILQDGDNIYVPSNTQTVLVGGQVTNPGHLLFISGADYRYYIQKAGGFSEYADAGETRIIKKATLEWMDPGNTTIEPGDQVWVPKKPRREFYYYFSIARDLIGVIASVITAVYIVNQVSK